VADSLVIQPEFRAEGQVRRASSWSSFKKAGLILCVLLLLIGCYDPTSGSAKSIGDAPSVGLQVALPWSASVTYSKGDLVTMPEWTLGGPIYESLQDGNIGVEPPGVNVQGDGWKPMAGAPGWAAWWRLAPERQGE